MEKQAKLLKKREQRHKRESPQMIQSIMDELKGDKDLNMFLEDIEMNDYVLEEEEEELY